MPLALPAIPVIIGAGVGVYLTLKEAFKMQSEGKSLKEEKRAILQQDGPKETSEPIEP